MKGRLNHADRSVQSTSLLVIRPPCLLAILLTMCLVGLNCVPACGEIWSCTDSSGAVRLTNAPEDPSCTPYGFTVPRTVFLREGGGQQAAPVARKESGSDNMPQAEKGVVKTSDPAAYDGLIRTVARRYNIDPPLIKAIIHTESDFDHRAVSGKGALGLMQLMPETARELQVANPFNPGENIDGGTRYLRLLLDSFNNDLVLSLAAYNAGPGLVRRTGGVPQIPETVRYINKVLKNYKYYRGTW